MNEQFRLVIKITKGDRVGRILKRMASGQIIVFNTRKEATLALTEFLADAHALIQYVPSKFQMFGLICIHDEKTGDITDVEPFFVQRHTDEFPGIVANDPTLEEAEALMAEVTEPRE